MSSPSRAFLRLPSRIASAFRLSRRMLLPPDIAIDFGTANTLVALVGDGIVANEPTIAAVDRAQRRVLAIGAAAKRMLGRTPPGIETVQPLRGGVIAELEIAEALLRHHIHRALSHPVLLRPRVAVSIPANTTSVERRALREAAKSAGARSVVLVQESIAAALGAGLPVLEPQGQLIVDIGAGTTEVAVMALGGVVASRTIPVAGQSFDDAIAHYLRREHNLLVGASSAESIKIELASAVSPREVRKGVARGRDLVEGVPRRIEISVEELVLPLQEPLGAILAAVHQVLEVTPPELASDVASNGIHLVGGASQLRGIASLLERRTGLPVHPVDHPEESVVRGCLRCLEDTELLHRIGLSAS